MPWERTTRSPDDVRAFIERSLASTSDEDANGIWVAGEFAGTVGLRVDPDMNTGEIGYWNVRSFEGRGLITEACRRLVEHGFHERMLHRIEIHAAAERLGFTLEGTMRDGHRRSDDIYVDQVVYGLLASDRVET
jgi:ribosomal-protein-serine acetyltransferase